MLEATDLHVEAFWDDLNKLNRLLGGFKLMFTKEKHLDQFKTEGKLIKDIAAGRWTSSMKDVQFERIWSISLIYQFKLVKSKSNWFSDSSFKQKSIWTFNLTTEISQLSIQIRSCL